MKIKDLPNSTNLNSVKFKVPTGHSECPLTVAYWVSQWGYLGGNAGVWCKKIPSDSQIYPIFLDQLAESLEFEVV